MIAVVQRVLSARVTVEGAVVGEIGAGLCVLVAVERDDTDQDVAWMASKLATLRVFRNGDKYFDLDVKQIGGGILLVSNFTVAADTSSGRRPGLSPAAAPDVGRVDFDKLVAAVRGLDVPVQTGQFGAEMKVDIANDGPVTLVVSSRESRRVEAK